MTQKSCDSSHKTLLQGEKALPSLLASPKADRAAGAKDARQQVQENSEARHNVGEALGDMSLRAADEDSHSSECVSLFFSSPPFRSLSPFAGMHDITFPIVITPELSSHHCSTRGSQDEHRSRSHSQSQLLSLEHQESGKPKEERFLLGALPDFFGEAGNVSSACGVDRFSEAPMSVRQELDVLFTCDPKEDVRETPLGDDVEDTVSTANCVSSFAWALPCTRGGEQGVDSLGGTVLERANGGWSLTSLSPPVQSTTCCRPVSVSCASCQEAACEEERQVPGQIQLHQEEGQPRQANVQSGQAHENTEQATVPHTGDVDSTLNTSPTSTPSVSVVTPPGIAPWLMPLGATRRPLEGFCSVSISPLSPPLSTRFGSSEGTCISQRESHALFGVLTSASLEGVEAFPTTHVPPTRFSLSLNGGNVEAVAGSSFGVSWSTSGIYDLSLSRTPKCSSLSTLSQRLQDSSSRYSSSSSDVPLALSSGQDSPGCCSKENEKHDKRVPLSTAPAPPPSTTAATMTSLQLVAAGTAAPGTTAEAPLPLIPPLLLSSLATLQATPQGVKRAPPFRIMRRPPIVPCREFSSFKSAPFFGSRASSDERGRTVAVGDEVNGESGCDDGSGQSSHACHKCSVGQSPLPHRGLRRHSLHDNATPQKRAQDAAWDVSSRFEELEQIRASNYEALEERELHVSFASDTDCVRDVAVRAEGSVDCGDNDGDGSHSGNHNGDLNEHSVRRFQRTVSSSFEKQETPNDMSFESSLSSVKNNNKKKRMKKKNCGATVIDDSVGDDQKREEMTGKGPVIKKRREREKVDCSAPPGNTVSFAEDTCGSGDNGNVQRGGHQRVGAGSDDTGGPPVSLGAKMKKKVTRSSSAKDLRKSCEGGEWGLNKKSTHAENHSCRPQDEDGVKDDKTANASPDSGGNNNNNSNDNDGVLCGAGEQSHGPSTTQAPPPPQLLATRTPRLAPLPHFRDKLVSWLRNVSPSERDGMILRILESCHPSVERRDAGDDTTGSRRRRRTPRRKPPGGSDSPSRRRDATKIAATTTTTTRRASPLAAVSFRGRFVAEEPRRAETPAGRTNTRRAVGPEAGANGRGPATPARSMTTGQTATARGRGAANAPEMTKITSQRLCGEKARSGGCAFRLRLRRDILSWPGVNAPPLSTGRPQSPVTPHRQSGKRGGVE